MPTKKKRSARNIKWIEDWCRIPEGKRGSVGKRLILREWQRKELRKIYDNPHGTRQAILSFPRKNGKTALIACLLLLHLAGPEAVPNSQLYSSAISREQAATVFKLASKMVRLNPDFAGVITIRDTAKELLCHELGTYYAALSAEKSTAHGKSPVFAIHDELGQVIGPNSALYEAVETGMGAHDAPLSIVISTQAPTDNDLLSRLIDDALSSRDPQTVVSVHSAPLDADPFSEETLKACNPAWGDFLNADEVLRKMREAQAMPTSEASYRNLHLNQRVESSAPYVTRAVWASCGSDVQPLDAVPVYGGLDLSAVSDLTAWVMIGEVNGVWQVHPKFWLPEHGLREKSAHDRVQYDVWHSQGHLLTSPGKSVSYEYVAQYIRADFDKYDIRKVGFDRWAFVHFKPWLLKAGFTEEEIEEKFVEFGQGTKSMTPALRALSDKLLNKQVAHGMHPVLTMCAGNAVAKGTDDDRKLDKIKSAGRIDGMVALADAFGVAPLNEPDAVSVFDQMAQSGDVPMLGTAERVHEPAFVDDFDEEDF